MVMWCDVMWCSVLNGIVGLNDRSLAQKYDVVVLVRLNRCIRYFNIQCAWP